MKALILLASVFMTFLQLSAQIKYSTYWVAPSIPANMGSKLASDDLLIVDYENLVNNRLELEMIKIGNPNIKLLIYSNPMEIWNKDIANRPLANSLRAKLPAAYKLKRSDGKPVIFWKNMEMMNMSVNCPRVNGKNYNEFYAEWLLINALADPLVDGYFEDNGTPTIAWVDPLIDSDNDGKPDNPSALNNAWQNGQTQFLSLIRKAKGDKFIIVTNKGEKHFFFINDGVMFEKFPNDYLGSKRAGGWYQCIANAKHAGPYTIFQVDSKNLEFGIASSLLLDEVYISLGQNIQVPEQFRTPTGKAISAMYKKGSTYCRDYELVTVEVNPELKTGRLVKRTTAP